MTDTAALAPYAEGDFSVGRVLNRTFELLTRNFIPFFTVTAVASVPSVLVAQGQTFEATSSGADIALGLGLMLLGLFLGAVLYTLSQAIVLFGAFQDMRGRRVSLVESLQVGLRRFFPVVGLAFCTSILIGFGVILLIAPGLIFATMWFVATPACVVERLGPFRSMGRSGELTKGHRWKILGLMLLLYLISLIISPSLGAALGIMGGKALVLLGTLIWSGIWGAFYAIAAVVAYHDLRVAKEGIDIHQIASVFE
jgi:hypothetical protein